MSINRLLIFLFLFLGISAHFDKLVLQDSTTFAKHCPFCTEIEDIGGAFIWYLGVYAWDSRATFRIAPNSNWTNIEHWQHIMGVRKSDGRCYCETMIGDADIFCETLLELSTTLDMRSFYVSYVPLSNLDTIAYRFMSKTGKENFVYIDDELMAEEDFFKKYSQEYLDEQFGWMDDYNESDLD